MTSTRPCPGGGRSLAPLDSVPPGTPPRRPRRLPYLHSCRGGVRPRRTKRSFVPWFCTLLLVCAAWFKLFAIVSLITKLHAHVSGAPAAPAAAAGEGWASA